MAAVLDKMPALRVGRVDVTGIIRDTLKEAGEDDISGLAAQMTYHIVLAVFPFMLFLAGVTAIIEPVFGVENLTDRIVDKASQTMPDDATSVLRDFVDEVVHARGGTAITIGLLGSLWAASSAMSTAMKALNRTYDVEEERGFVKKRIVALALTIGFGGLVLAATALFATGRFMAGGIGDWLGWESQFVTTYNLATAVGAIALVMLAVALLYYLAPNVEHGFEWVSLGAVLFVFAWLIFSAAFAFYLSNFASYNRVYGSLAAVIILLIWMYWTNFLLLLGAELNSVLARRYDEECQRDAAGKTTPPPPRH
jgi:membrane protein